MRRDDTDVTALLQSAQPKKRAVSSLLQYDIRSVWNARIMLGNPRTIAPNFQVRAVKPANE